MRALRTVVVSLVIVVLVGVSGAAAKPQRCNGERRLCDRTLDQVVLPATHNAMSAASLGWVNPNQEVGIPDQLRLGIRGFLLDTYYAVRRSDGTVVNAEGTSEPTRRRRVYLCHVRCELGATPLVDALRAMRDFLEGNPDEVMVIVNEDYVTPRGFAKVVRQSGLSRYVYRGKAGPRWPTLRRMIARHQQVVLLAESDVKGVPWYRPAYEGILQETPYTWPDVRQLTDPGQLNASCIANRGGDRGSLFLLNHWSPPYPASTGTARVVNKTGALVRRARACASARGHLPTLLAVDRFRTGGLFTAVRKLNESALPR